MTETFLRESTKFTIVPAPTEVPGTCASCGASSTEDRDYIDFGVFVEWVGVTYFCTLCFTECANAIGFINPEQARSLENKLEQALLTISNFHTKDRALNDAIDLLRNSGLFGAVDSTIGLVDEIPSQDLDTGFEPDNSGIDESELNTNKQDPKQGSSDLSAVGSDEFNLNL